MGSPPISEDAGVLRLLDLSGVPAGSPREWTPMWVEAQIPLGDWESAELVRGESALPLTLRRLAGEVRVLAEWPRSGPGNYELRLRSGRTLSRQTLTVHPEKIDEGSFRRLLEDLETRLPASIAVALQRLGGLAGLELLEPQRSTLAEELLRLRRAVLGTERRPGLAEILPRISRDPHQVLRTEELWVRRHRARRPHPARLAQALVRSGNLSVDLRPERVVDTRVEHSVDVYENRLVRAYVDQVARRLRRIARVLTATGDESMLAQAAALAHRLDLGRRSASFLAGVSELTRPPTEVTMVLQARPDYRAALEGFLEFQRSVAVRLEEGAVDAPLENLPHLYQLWGTLQVLDVLLDVGIELGYRLERERLVAAGRGGTFLRVLPDGQSAVVLAHPERGMRARLIPERSYRGQGTGLHSITYTQRPDLALEVQDAAAGARVYLLDPKYKLDGEALEGEEPAGKPKKVDLDKMHAYRDAIRDAGGRRVVRYAAILYPGPEHRYSDGIEALSAYPGAEESLRWRVREMLREALSD